MVSDLNHSPAFLHQRDRDIGLSAIHHNKNPTKISSSLRQWISALRDMQPGPSRGHRVQSAVTILTIMLWVFGLCVGTALSHSVLFYDGSQPINIFHALLFLVVTQVLTLLLLIIFIVGRFRNLLSAVSIFNPASLLLRMARILRLDKSEIFSATLPGSDILSRVRQPLLIYLSQQFTVAFNLGILAVLMYLVSTSDLAFGWNTTLDVSAHTAYQGFKALGSPWVAILPDAIPSLNVVEQSRFYRLEGDLANATVNPGALASWWVYLLMVIIVYGAIPRLIALLISGHFYDKTLRQGIQTHPHASLVIHRLFEPFVATQSEQSETNLTQAPAFSAFQQRQSQQPIQCLVIEWAMVRDIRDNGQHLISLHNFEQAGLIPKQYFSAGGHQSLEQDKKVVDDIILLQPSCVAVLAKAWEPPTLDFSDLIYAMGSKLGQSCHVVILLKPLDAKGITAGQIHSWESVFSPSDAFPLFIEVIT